LLPFSSAVTVMEQTNAEDGIKGVVRKRQIEDVGTQPAPLIVLSMVLNDQLYHIMALIRSNGGYPKICHEWPKPAIATGHVKQQAVSQMAIRQQGRHNTLFAPVYPRLVNRSIAPLLISPGSILNQTHSLFPHLYPLVYACSPNRF
jgi:hypothetical protein